MQRSQLGWLPYRTEKREEKALLLPKKGSLPAMSGDQLPCSSSLDHSLTSVRAWWVRGMPTSLPRSSWPSWPCTTFHTHAHQPQVRSLS
jgi:hypothetical protein